MITKMDRMWTAQGDAPITWRRLFLILLQEIQIEREGPNMCLTREAGVRNGPALYPFTPTKLTEEEEMEIFNWMIDENEGSDGKLMLKSKKSEVLKIVWYAELSNATR